MNNVYDLIIIGGGIHGTAIAADAAGRGLRVLLCEQGDLASATSSASSKLIHGGLRYLEHFDFRLVKEALREREILIRQAPHLVFPLPFIIPYAQQHRPFWFIRLGLYLYDFLAASHYFASSQSLKLDADDLTNPLQKQYQKALMYTDAATDDARLVIMNAHRAHSKGATILTQTECTQVKESHSEWQVTLKDKKNNQSISVQGKALINATGPWIDHVLDNLIQQKSNYRVRLVKGSHIVIPNITGSNKAYLLQNEDKRIIFVTPYCRHFTMIGTTDIPFNTSLNHIQIDSNEVNYLLSIANQFFKTQVQPSNIISSWSGVRTLLDDNSAQASKNTREYKIELRPSQEHQLPYINIFGGKLTTHRKLAEKTVDLLKPYFPSMKPQWTHLAPFPGYSGVGGKEDILLTLTQQYPWLDDPLLTRYVSTYGTLAEQFLKNANKKDELGHYFGHGLYEAEVRYLIAHEWAHSADDILWRRTKLGLYFSEEEKTKLEGWVRKNYPLEQMDNWLTCDPIG